MNDLSDDIKIQEEEFEEQMRRRYGGGGGKSHPTHHGSKTNKFIKSQIIEDKIKHRTSEAKEDICKVLSDFPDFQNKDLEDRYIEEYLKWLKGCFEGKKLLLNPKDDFEFQTFRSSSNGGQNVNKTETAVRATHKYSNISAHNEEERDQIDNKKAAVLHVIDRLKKHLTDWKEYLNGKDINSINRYDILELIEEAILNSKR